MNSILIFLIVIVVILFIAVIIVSSLVCRQKKINADINTHIKNIIPIKSVSVMSSASIAPTNLSTSAFESLTAN